MRKWEERPQRKQRGLRGRVSPGSRAGALEAPSGSVEEGEKANRESPGRPHAAPESGPGRLCIRLTLKCESLWTGVRVIGRDVFTRNVTSCQEPSIPGSQPPAVVLSVQLPQSPFLGISS